MSYLEVKNLNIGYDKNIIISDINFKIDKGDYLCIIGENGSGKSTLMKTLLGLQSKISGDIIFSDGLNKNEIGYLPQQTVVQKDFPASVEEIVISGCLGKQGLFSFYSKKDTEKANKNMERMGITNLRNRCYRELSGGQQQRVLLARALCAADKVILLDEPVAGLDPAVTKEMYSLIENLNNDGMSIIMISHDLDAALKYASHILHVNNGSAKYSTLEEYNKRT